MSEQLTHISEWYELYLPAIEDMRGPDDVPIPYQAARNKAIVLMARSERGNGVLLPGSGRLHADAGTIVTAGPTYFETRKRAWCGPASAQRGDWVVLQPGEGTLVFEGRHEGDMYRVRICTHAPSDIIAILKPDGSVVPAPGWARITRDLKHSGLIEASNAVYRDRGLATWQDDGGVWHQAHCGFVHTMDRASREPEFAPRSPMYVVRRPGGFDVSEADAFVRIQDVVWQL